MSNQLIKFAESLKLYAYGKDDQVVHYPGHFTKTLALQIAKTAPIDADLWQWATWGSTRTIGKQQKDLQAFGVTFDTWYYESHLHDPAASALKAQGALGNVYMDGNKGQPICINCATEFQYTKVGEKVTITGPCSLCTGMITPIVCEKEYHPNPISVDPGLHPGNNFYKDENGVEYW